MGTVYLAVQTGPGTFCREVVVKYVNLEASEDPEYRRMLSDEAQQTARVNHPNVVKVFDVGEDDEGMFIVLERVLGINLAELREKWQGPVPPEVAAGLLAQCCSGLQAAHDLEVDGRAVNLIHRDVSLQNVMVDTSGLVRVIDFGIARADDRQAQTGTGRVRGNVAYMAPEQLAGLPIDATVDAYATAVVFYELCTGLHPFGRTSVRRELPPLRASGVAVSAAVEELIAASLALEPGPRPRRIEALGEALRAFARQHWASEPRALAAFFRERGISLEPPLPRALVADTGDDGEAADDGPPRVHVSRPGEQELALPDGQRLRVYSTPVRGGAGDVELALSRVEGLLPAPLKVVCSGDALSLRAGRSRDPGARASLYMDAQQRGTRQEQLLVTAALPDQSLDFGDRGGRVCRLVCGVGRRGSGGLLANLKDPAVQIVAPPDVHLMFVISVADLKARVVHAECVCIT
jgi:serine/threonine protein kinase